MNLLALFRRPKPVRQPGRHCAEWAAMVQGLTELQARCHAAEAACRTHRAEQVQTEVAHAADVQGWEDALDFSSEQFVELERLYDERGREIARLEELLSASTGGPGIHVDAPIDQGCRDTPHAAETTVQATLADLESTGEHGLTEQLLAGLRQSHGPKPPLPSEVTQELAIPLGASPLALPVEVSASTGDRARESVRVVLAAAP